jgi:hypothetical protein
MTPGDVLGHEPMGIVEAVGSGVDNLSVGDRVVVPFNISCGHCFMCGLGFQSQHLRRLAVKPSCCGFRMLTMARSSFPMGHRMIASCSCPTCYRRRGRPCSTPTSARARRCWSWGSARSATCRAESRATSTRGGYRDRTESEQDAALEEVLMR